MSNEELLKALDSFVVVGRDGSVIACAALFLFFEEKCGELASIAVSPECCGHGQGGKLLGSMQVGRIVMTTATKQPSCGFKMSRQLHTTQQVVQSTLYNCGFKMSRQLHTTQLLMGWLKRSIRQSSSFSRNLFPLVFSLYFLM